MADRAIDDLQHPGYERLEAAIADVCPVHGVEHQPRDWPTRCTICDRETWNPHALCDKHELEVATP